MFSYDSVAGKSSSLGCVAFTGNRPNYATNNLADFIVLTVNAEVRKMWMCQVLCMTHHVDGLAQACQPRTWLDTSFKYGVLYVCLNLCLKRCGKLSDGFLYLWEDLRWVVSTVVSSVVSDSIRKCQFDKMHLFNLHVNTCYVDDSSTYSLKVMTTVDQLCYRLTWCLLQHCYDLGEVWAQIIVAV